MSTNTLIQDQKHFNTGWSKKQTSFIFSSLPEFMKGNFPPVPPKPKQNITSYTKF